MRIVVHDYSGHPFQVQLSRELARRGHDVLHVSASSFQTPKGRLHGAESDPPTFQSVTVVTRRPFMKDNFLRRRSQEIEIGDKVGDHIAAFQPDVVISSNAPIDTQVRVLRATRRANAAFVFWVQDLYGEAIRRILSCQLGFIGRWIGNFYRWREGRMIAAADHVVVIADDFVPAVRKLSNIPDTRLSVIENWAPLDEVPQLERDNAWARRELAPVPFRMIYSGTLGLKHNPGLLLEIAKVIDGEVLVFSEGSAATKLAEDARAENLTNLRVSGWLPFEDLPSALAAADALIVILEPDAGIFSVPSKVLTYMCAGRAILGAIPLENRAARMVREVGAGLVVSPLEPERLTANALALQRDVLARHEMGVAARAYAERAFSIVEIGERFQSIVEGLEKTR
ncbi:MAG: glycosyltransferase family 4 protein [Novosphingobium sp.]